MGKLEQYRKIIQTLIEKHASYSSSNGEIETLKICDLINDNYLLMTIGWNPIGRVHHVALHIRIRDHKIWIEWDGIEDGVTQELLEAGVLKEDIVFGFYRPEKRSQVDFSAV